MNAKSGLNRLIAKPAEVRQESYRFFFVTNLAYLFGLFLHIAFLVVFAVLSIYAMVLYNLVSCAVYFSSFFLNRQGKHNSAALLSALEVIAHAGLSTWLIGWQSGFHYYILVILPLGYFINSFRRYQQHLVALFSGCSYLGLFFYSVHYAPGLLLSPGLLQLLQMMNAVGMLVGLGFIAYYYSQVNQQITVSLLSESVELQKRNEEMEQDLELARRIQMSLIPARAPIKDLAFYYKSMDQVGGDFYDFIEFEGQDKLGIFISDVSGHGVAAAFITSLIKGAVVQAAPRYEHPSELLRHLNKSLYGQINNNFITAFYGIYDLQTRQFVYANAGHNAPYRITAERIVPLDSKYRSFPLAVLSAKELAAGNRDYYDAGTVLMPGEKLLLFTDGLEEAVAPSAPESQYGDSALLRVLQECVSLSPEKTVQSLTADLLQFRGSDRFEDDVCIVCLQA